MRGESEYTLTSNTLLRTEQPCMRHTLHYARQGWRWGSIPTFLRAMDQTLFSGDVHVTQEMVLFV